MLAAVAEPMVLLLISRIVGVDDELSFEVELVTADCREEAAVVLDLLLTCGRNILPFRARLGCNHSVEQNYAQCTFKPLESS